MGTSHMCGVDRKFRANRAVSEDLGRSVSRWLQGTVHCERAEDGVRQDELSEPWTADWQRPDGTYEDRSVRGSLCKS
jgi:hypothetical protein